MVNLHGNTGIQMDKRGMKNIMNMESYIGYLVNLHGNTGIQMDKRGMKNIMNMENL